VLTQQDGANPNLWADVRRYLPLLAKRKHYQGTKHGYARGWEPVEYVQNVRQFYDILTWQHSLDERRLAAAGQGSFEKVQTVVTEDSAPISL
jgi:membrane-bound lytic murein transglycosylase F